MRSFPGPWKRTKYTPAGTTPRWLSPLQVDMFASIRKYGGAPLLVDELVKRQDDIKSVLGPIPGFHAY